MLTMEAELRALREELTHRPSAKRPPSASSDKHSDQASEWPTPSGGDNNNDLPKPTNGNGTNGGDHTLKVLSKSNGSSVENIEEKTEPDSDPVATIKTELVDVDDATVTDKENFLVNENNE